MNRSIALIITLSISEKALACFSGDYAASYNLAQWLLILAGLLICIGSSVLIYNFRKYWAASLFIPALALSYPVISIYQQWGMCCDCGNGVVVQATISLAIGIFTLLTSIYCFFKYAHKT